MQELINNIKVTFSNYNCCHETADDLVCSVCNKKASKVFALFSTNNEEDVRFACSTGQCFPQLLKEMFIEYEDEFLNACSITDIKYSSKKTSRKRTRSEMTLKLRYKILKRDNFMCVICGRRPPDVELCVDHIEPVAKGGSNSESNLRTLCTDCNLGKGVDE